MVVIERLNPLIRPRKIQYIYLYGTIGRPMRICMVIPYESGAIYTYWAEHA